MKTDFAGFSFGIFEDPPGQVWADFIHATDEFVVVAEGTVDIEIDGERARCGPGDLALIPAGARHTLRTSPDAGSRWFYGYGTLKDGHD
ncbi:MAG: hypothetical protein AcusKO_33090 [Acuticoccus sp.]